MPSISSDLTRQSRQFSQKIVGDGSIKINLPQRERKEINIEEFVRNINIELYAELDEEKQEEFLANIDAIELFDTLKELDNELAKVRLEMHFLTDFLEQNNPKLLIGLKQRRSTVNSMLKQGGNLSNPASESTGLMPADSSRRSMTGTITGTASILGIGGATSRRVVAEYRLNLRTKTDMAEKSAVEVEKRVKIIEKEARREIKQLRAQIEELSYRAEETEETTKNFMLHFMADDNDLSFLETASEKQLIHKLHKFTSNWFKNARGLMATMRLRINHLQESCQQYRSELIIKSDLSKILSAVDFEQLMIKRSQLLQALDEKFLHMTGIKSKTGKASMAMGEEKQSMMMLEDKHKQVINKIVEVLKAISKLEVECKLVENSNEKDLAELQAMQEQLARYQAPSVNSYIERKNEISGLEKEEKMLRRKINIMNMKLSNLNKRYKKRNLY